MPSKLFIPGLIGGMILTGACNSLWSKFQDMQCVENCDDPQHQVLYEQPVWQTLQMFLGEMLCFLPVLFAWLKTKYRSAPLQLPSDSDGEPLKPAPQQLRGWKILLLWLPAACDLTGTTLMNIGLLYTPVSIYQMTRGALVLFVGVLSVIFLRRRLWLYQWISLVTVMAGVALVGLSGSMIKDTLKESPLGNVLGLRPSENTTPEPIDVPEATTVLVGVFFILFAQIFTATQFVIEEKIMSRYAVAPLVAVGFEGLFGFITILIFIPILSIPSVAACSPFFDLTRGWHQTIGTPSVLWSGVVIACSIALFNFFGLSVTRHVSATARSLTDTCRTLAIWVVSLGLGWEKLLFPISLLQVLGFSLLVYGTFLFNNLVKAPPCLPMPRTADFAGQPSGNAEEAEGLLISSHLDETAAFPADLGQSGYDVIPDDEHIIGSKTKTPGVSS
jgi:drug/metabolite transporter (DMT)-like permease